MVLIFQGVPGGKYHIALIKGDMQRIELPNNLPSPIIVWIRVFGTDKPRWLQKHENPGLYGVFGKMEDRIKRNVLLMKSVH